MRERMRAKLAILIAIVGVVIGGVWPGTVLAATPTGPFNVVVAPVSQNLEAKPGSTVSTTLQVRNQNLQTEQLKITVMKFSASGQDGTPQLLKLGPGDDFGQWIHFSTTQIAAEPNVWEPVKVTINPPAGAAFGYYYAVVFQRANAATTAPKAITPIGAVASLILLDVQAPGAVRQANLVEFSTANKVSEFLPANFKIRLHNTGNVHVAPRGNIFISKGGKNLALIEVNLVEGNILPKSYRLFTAQWTDGKPVYKVQQVNGKVVHDKQGNPVTHLDWSNFNLSKLRYGKYDAKLVMVYNNGKSDVADQAKLSFWVIPWRIIFGALLALVLIVAGVWSLVIRPLRRRVGGPKQHGRFR